MAFTKLYLTNSAAPYTPATIRGAWDDAGGAVTKALSPLKEFGGLNTAVTRAETDSGGNYDVLLYRGISGQLAAQTISGNIDVVIGIAESQGDCDMAWHLHVYVTQGDSDTPRGTLISDYVETTAHELPVTTLAGFALASAQAMSSLAVSSGDRIVVEIGYVALNTIAGSRQASMRYGTLANPVTGQSGKIAADLAVSGTDVTTKAGFISFSASIAEADNAEQASSLAALSLSRQLTSPTHVSSLIALTLTTTPAGGGGGGITPVLDSAAGLVEICFGVAPSGKPGYRNWVKEHANIVAHWFLSDVGVVGAEDEIYPNDAGIYNGAPAKGVGLLPEFGLSTTFDGATQFVEVDFDNFGLGTNDPFTFALLCRPAAVTSAAARCLLQSGSTGGYLALNTSGQFIFGKNGGSVVTLSEVVEAGGAYFVVGRFNGTNAQLDVWAMHDQSASDPGKTGRAMGTAGPTAISIGPHGGSNAYIGKRASEEFAGDIQGVAVFSDDLSDADVAELLECCAWTDVTGDARASVPIEMSRGLLDDDPTLRMAPVGVCKFALNNAANNSAGLAGYYSPDHANARAGFRRGAAVRVSLESDTLGLSSTQFIGALYEIVPTTGQHEDRLTYCTAYDWLEEAAKFLLDGIEAQEDVTADEVLELIISRMPNKPHALSLATGSDVYPVALDNVLDEQATAQAEFGRIVLSELGLIYVTGSGAFTFESRTSRALITSVSHAIDDSMISARAEATVDQVKTLVRITTHPRRVDAAATTVLYESSTRIALDVGTTKTFLQFRDPSQEAARFGGLAVVTPLPTTHYTINSAQDGSGSDLTGNALITVSFEISGSGIYLEVVNAYGNRVYLDLQVLGKGVYDFEPVTVIEKDDDLIKAIGVNPVNLDMPYQSAVPVAQSAALQILNIYSDESTRLLSAVLPAHKDDATLQIAILAEVSQRITASESQTGIMGQFFINGLKLRWEQDRACFLEVFLAPADTQSYWVVGTSALDLDARLGY